MIPRGSNLVLVGWDPTVVLLEPEAPVLLEPEAPVLLDVLVVLVIAGGVWDCEELVVLAVLCDCVVTDVGFCVPTSDWATVAGLEAGTDLVAAVPSLNCVWVAVPVFP